jgi:hypothetical protein
MARLPEHLQVECLEESARQLAPADIERAMMFACEINSRLQREHVLVEVATIASKRSAAAVARLGDRIFEPLLNDYAMFLQATSPGGPTGVDVQAFLAGIESPLVVRWTRLAISLSRSPDAATHGTALGPALVDERLAFQALQSVEKDHDQALTDALAIQDVDLRRQTALAVVRKILPTQPQKASFVLRTKLGLADPKQEIMSALMDVCDHHTVDLPGVFAELMPRLSPYGRLQILEYCCPSRPELVREYAEKYDVDVTMPMVACFVCTGLIQDDIATLMERLPENPYHDKAFGCEAVRRARANDVWLPHFEAISSSFIRAETRGRIAESLYRAGHPDQARREALEIELPQIRAQTLIRLIEMGDWSLDEALKAALSAITDVRQLTELAKLEAQARIINDNPVGALQAVRNVHEQQARMAVLRIIARSLSTKTLRHGIQMSSGVLVGSPRGQWCLALAERFLELHPRPEIGSEQE